MKACAPKRRYPEVHYPKWDETFLEDVPRRLTIQDAMHMAQFAMDDCLQGLDVIEEDQHHDGNA